MTTTTQNKMQLTWCRTWGGAVYAERTVPVAKGAELDSAVMQMLRDVTGEAVWSVVRISPWAYRVRENGVYRGLVTVRYSDGPHHDGPGDKIYHFAGTGAGPCFLGVESGPDASLRA